MNTADVFAFVIEYGTIPLMVGLLVVIGWFAYDETQKATNDAKGE